MKTRLLIILIVFGFTYSIFSVHDTFGWCPQNEDWSDKPCYAPYQNFGIEQKRSDWESYYDFKGSEWMELKKQEMNQVIQNDTLLEWIKSTLKIQAHRNVHEYYFIFGEVQNIDDKFVEVNYVDFSDASGEIILPCEGVDSIAEYTKEQCLFVRYMQMPLIIGIIISVIVTGVIFWRKRK